MGLCLETNRTTFAVKERDFSIRARRSTRIALRVPVRISSSESRETVQAWSVVVNRHGARFQCKQVFATDQRLGILVLATGKSATGKVIWANARPDSDGNFEFAVQLDRPINLFSVNFPLHDWKQETAEHYEVEQDILASASVAAPPEAAPQETKLEETAEVATAADSSPVPANGQDSHEEPLSAAASDAPDSAPENYAPQDPPVFPGFEAAAEPADIADQPASSPEALDLTAELIPAIEEPSAKTEEHVSGESLPAQMNPPAEPAGDASQPDTSSFNEPPVQSVIQALSAIESDAVPTSVPAGRESSGASREKGPSDRLTDVLNELIECSVRTRADGEADKLIEGAKGKFADLEQTALSRIDQQASDLIASHTTALEKHAAEMAAHARRTMEKELLRLAEADAQRSRRVQQQAEQTIAAAVETLRTKASVQMPLLQEEFVQQCRSRAEELLSASVENSRREILDCAAESRKQIEGIMDGAQNTLTNTADQIEKRSTQVLTETAARLEGQLSESAQSLLSRHTAPILSQLDEKGENMLEQARRQITAASERHSEEMRNELAALLRTLAETVAGNKHLVCADFAG